eukprot:Rhum_TRINITY_DN14020_c0_g1::Rhum_TRINITY_DN14020_c0_g1_i1::g.67571::m.67571
MQARIVEREQAGVEVLLPPPPRRREVYVSLGGRLVPDFIASAEGVTSWGDVRYEDEATVLAVSPSYILLCAYTGRVRRYIRCSDVQSVDVRRSPAGHTGVLTLTPHPHSPYPTPLSVLLSFLPPAQGGTNTGDPASVLLHDISAACDMNGGGDYGGPGGGGGGDSARRSLSRSASPSALPHQPALHHHYHPHASAPPPQSTLPPNPPPPPLPPPPPPPQPQQHQQQPLP